ncbi:hypothetical protein [Arsenophonus nasoniae]
MSAYVHPESVISSALMLKIKATGDQPVIPSLIFSSEITSHAA